MSSVSASAAFDDASLASIRNLKIDNGTITQIERDSSPSITLPDGRTIDKLQPRTIVKIVLNPARGSNIRVEIWLPDAGRWNARLLGHGNGGSAGGIPVGSLAWSSAAGYAAVTTDMGTAPNSDSGVGNPEVWKDFGYRATHLMTVSAKQVIKAYYGKDPEYSYFSGGSTGGQQALQEAQRYPEDYDGIVANVPAHCRTPLHAYFLWNDQIINKCHFTESQLKNVMAAGNEYMASREMPAIAGKFVSDPRCNSQDIQALVALAVQKDPTINHEQAEGLKKIFEGPRHAVTGERIFDGVPFGSDIAQAHGHLYLFRWVFGVDKKMSDINFADDMDTYTARLGPYLNAENPDLSQFHKHGGKLIMISGSADSIVPYTATMDYYERMIEHFGGLEAVQAFCRFYIIPGMGHSGGPGLNTPPNMLDAVRNWRETGKAPGELRARRTVDGKTELDMPVYPYPAKNGWDAATSSYKPVDGPRGGVGRIARRFSPAPAGE